MPLLNLILPIARTFVSKAFSFFVSKEIMKLLVKSYVKQTDNKIDDNIYYLVTAALDNDYEEMEKAADQIVRSLMFK